jgi:NADH-quinone oxidoreductase subunit N
MFLNTETLQAGVLRDCSGFLPELILCGGIVLMLLLRLFSGLDRLHQGWVALLIAAAALAVAVFEWLGGVAGIPTPRDFYDQANTAELFTGLLVYDYFTVFLRIFLLGFALLVIWLSLVTGIPDREDSADFHTLLLGATLGMAIMASTNHLLMMFIGIEMASLPSYALAGYLKGRRASSEAALKYVVYGGGAAGVMLYGISLLAGRFGTAYLPEMASAYVAAVSAGSLDPLLLLGTMFVLIGIAFKLAAVPFHFWCPDVFEGASAEVAGFLSVASKGAALALLARITLALGGMERLAVGGVVSEQMATYLVPALAVFAILTATFGNLAAYGQTNVKRLLAYSTIAHAGYMMMGLATLTTAGVRAVLFYLVAYLLMNLGAFAIVAFLRNQTGSEDLHEYRGLIRRSPWMVITLCVFILSLLGIPPLAGFLAKFEVFAALFRSAEEYAARGASGLSVVLYITLVFGGINSVMSAVYYVKVMKAMIIEERPEDLEGKEAVPLREPVPARVFAGVLAFAVFALLFIWGPINQAAEKGVRPYAGVSASTNRPGPLAQKEGKQP